MHLLSPTGEAAQVSRGMKANWFAAASCGLLSVWPGAVPCPAQSPLGFTEPGLLLFGPVPNAAGGLPLPPPAVPWQISSGPDLVSFGDHHPTPRQRQNIGVQRAALAGVPHDPAHPVLVLLARIAKGPDAARLQTDQGAT